MSKIKIVRLVTGEELLCSIKNDTATHLNVTNPVVIIPTQDGKLTFIPYISYAEFTELPIRVQDIMFVLNPSSNLSNKYNEMTGGIATPQQKIIT